ncbi:MAG: type II toxin-antitoxin system RelE/ParE family toxin [Planctomycetia bacterium]|nr:type II toxin-antitoxin system RelE/ParE family toxin [Planctomycetia bacterium]
MHEVRIGRSAVKELEALPDQIIDRVAAKVDSLSTRLRPTGCKKLRGGDDLWRVRVGDYRIIHAIDDTQLIVKIRVIRHRKDAYGPT